MASCRRDSTIGQEAGGKTNINAGRDHCEVGRKERSRYEKRSEGSGVTRGLTVGVNGGPGVENGDFVATAAR